MPAPASLRSQLVIGLSLMMLVATVSVGVITRWNVGRDTYEAQKQHAEALVGALASMLAPAMSKRPLDRVAVQRAVAHIGAQRVLRYLEVVDVAWRVVARSPSKGTRPSTIILRRAIRQRRAVSGVLRGGVVEAAAPIRAVRRVGAVRLRFSGAVVGSSTVVWVIVAVDTLVLLLFVAFVVTRYVARPLTALERAAAQVARGDLEVKLDEDGPRELASLALSFNAMTSSLREQLHHIEQQRRSLIRSEKLASVGRLAAGVAHEVGNPLQSIIGFADILLAGELDDTQRDFLERLQREAQRIHEIVRQMLDYSRPTEEGERGAVRYDDVVNQAVRLVRPQERFKRVEVVDKGIAKAPLVDANESRLVQVIVNLLLNAADAGAQRVTLSVEQDDECVSLGVANDGDPIADDHREHVFDPFFTTKDPGKGTGLGLAVSHSIVESFGGELSLAPQRELTTFMIRLPRHAPGDGGEPE
ncbi:MAG: HAMP domain-containing histidine kinase [Myxococcales bacterium]|nr:HAMP domain-containing histidine kinase [Myxococcales bacterium]